jgi:hypothetical protein
MTEELSHSKSEFQQTNSPDISKVVSAHPAKQNRKLLLQYKKSQNRWLVSGLAISGILFLLLIIGLVVIQSGTLEQTALQADIDSYMKYMAAKDVEHAYASAPKMSLSNIKRSLTDSYVLYEGYQSLSILSSTNIQIPDSPNVVTTISGIITYQNGVQRNFSCPIEKENEKWYIIGIFIDRDPITTPTNNK